jgi:hypothetical protein
MAPMASVNGRYVGPLDTSDAPELVAALREGRPVLPGRGLGDESPQSPVPSPQDLGPPTHPHVHPAGGTVDHPQDEELDR